MDQSGAIVGPVIASAVMILLGFTIRDVFYLSLIPGTVALFIILFVVKERAAIASGEFKFLEGVKLCFERKFSETYL